MEVFEGIDLARTLWGREGWAGRFLGRLAVGKDIRVRGGGRHFIIYGWGQTYEEAFVDAKVKLARRRVAKRRSAWGQAW